MKYNHAMTLAYEVISENPEMPTIPEMMAALDQRMELLHRDPGEQLEALTSDAPFDTYEIEE